MLIVERDTEALSCLIDLHVVFKKVRWPSCISIALTNVTKIALKLANVLLKVLYALILIGRVRLLKIADLAQ